MRIFTKWMSLALALMLCLGGTAALAESAPAFTEAPFLTEQGIYGNVTDRLPVAADVMVEDADVANGTIDFSFTEKEPRKRRGYRGEK